MVLESNMLSLVVSCLPKIGCTVLRRNAKNADFLRAPALACLSLRLIATGDESVTSLCTAYNNALLSIEVYFEHKFCGVEARQHGKRQGYEDAADGVQEHLQRHRTEQLTYRITHSHSQERCQGGTKTRHQDPAGHLWL